MVIQKIAARRQKAILPTLVLGLLLASHAAQGADPAKNYELLSIWQRNARGMLPMDVNAETPGDEIVGIFPNQIDVYSSFSRQHLKSFIIPADRQYAILPLPPVFDLKSLDLSIGILIDDT